MSTILTCLLHFGQRFQRLIMASRNPQPFNAVLQEMMMLIPQHKSPVLRVCETIASPILPLAVDKLVTDEGIHIFPNLMFKAIKLMSCDIQRNCISSFENLHVFICL